MELKVPKLKLDLQLIIFQTRELYLMLWFFPIQGLLAEQFTDIALALGSCGNTTGMAIGNYLTDSKLG